MTAFRMTAPVPLEREVHEAVAAALDALLLPPAFACCYPAGILELTAAQMARLTKAGLKSGMPDFLIFWQGVYLLELKREGGQLSRTQIIRTKHGALRERVGQVERFEQLCKTGAVKDLAVCYSVDGVIDQIAAWGIPHRAVAGIERRGAA